jgi:hypothetical protein
MKMKKFTLLSVVFLLYVLSVSQVVMAQAPDWTRVLQLNSTSAPMVNLVTTDANNVYMTVRISESTTFEGVHYTSIGLNDMLLVKMSNEGVTQWVRQLSPETGGTIIPNAIKVDENGNVFMAATFMGTITVGGIPISSGTLVNAIFGMFDATGKRVWATPFYSNGTGGSKIALDANGNSFLLSKTSKLLKFNHSGTILWEQNFTDRTLQAIAVHDANLYLGGGLQDVVTHFGTIDLTELGGYNTGFLVKGDLDGVYSKGIVVGGSTMGEGSVVSDMAIDNGGNLIVTGLYTKNLELGGITISNPTQSNYTYIAKCDNNLSFTWAKSSLGFINPGREVWTYRIFLDNSNNIYEFGMISNSITFGETTINPKTGNQFLFKFDSNGNAIDGQIIQNSYSDRSFVNQLGKIFAGRNSDGNFSITKFSFELGLDWLKSSISSTSGSASINCIKHDTAGNTYLQSRVTGYCDYFGTVINANNGVTVISKHDSAGKLVWMNQIADISPSIIGPVFILDKDNNVLIVGLFQTSLNIGTTTLNSTNLRNEAYVAKYNSNGGFLWAAKMDVVANVLSNITLSADNAGNVVVTGVNSPANYLVKFDASGNKLWTKSFPMESLYTSLVSTDANNNIYLTSEIHLSDASGSTTIGSIPLTQTSSDGATVLIKFDPDGNALWAKTYGGAPALGYSDSWPCDIKTDASGNTYLWGWCPNNAIFGAYTLANPIGIGYSLYLAKINTSGDVVWANAVYETKNGFNYGDLLDLDKVGNVYIGGHFKDRIRIEGTEYIPEGTNDFFAVKYSSTGLFQWIKTIPANTDIIKALSVKDNDILSVAGYAGINSTLGNFTISRFSGSNCIVATLGNLTTGTNETYNSNISVFPNPVNTTLFISGLTQNSTVSVFDLSGKLLMNKLVVSNQIDIRKLVNGIYTIRIVDKNGITTRKIVKQ